MTSRHTCPRCERQTSAAWCCGLHLHGARPFVMTPNRIRTCHVLKTRKGLDDEAYRARLQCVGVTTCKALDREQYHAFLKGLAALPDAPKAPAKPRAYRKGKPVYGRRRARG